MREQLTPLIDREQLDLLAPDDNDDQAIDDAQFEDVAAHVAIRGAAQGATLGSYKQGDRDGKWTWWYPNGQMQTEGAYWDKKKDGVWTEWWPSGQMKSQGAYSAVHDKKVLLWQYWTADGNASTENFDEWGNRK